MFFFRKVPHSWDEVQRLHQGVLSESFAEVIRSKFADLVDIIIVEFEKSEFERLLPQEVQNDVMEYRESVDSWKDRDEQVTQRFDAFAQVFSRLRTKRLSCDMWLMNVGTSALSMLIFWLCMQKIQEQKSGKVMAQTVSLSYIRAVTGRLSTKPCSIR